MNALYDKKIWIQWKYVEKDGKLIKLPVYNNVAIDITDKRYYRYFADIKENHGIIIDGIFGIDIDKIETQEEWLEAMKWVEYFDTYAEYSPSGKGIHIIGLNPNNIHFDKCRKGKYELYTKKRFFTVTFDSINNKDVIDITDKVQYFYDNVINRSNNTYIRKANIKTKDISQLINNKKFLDLYYGNISRYRSHSEADMSLISIISKYTKDPNEIEQIFCNSALYRKKTNSKRGDITYLRYTINKVLSK